MRQSRPGWLLATTARRPDRRVASSGPLRCLARRDERLRPPVQLADPILCLEIRESLASLELSTLADADSDQPRRSTDPETLALPIALHHRGERRQGRYATRLARIPTLSRPWPSPRCRRGRAWVDRGVAERRASHSPIARLAPSPQVHYLVRRGMELTSHSVSPEPSGHMGWGSASESRRGRGSRGFAAGPVPHSRSGGLTDRG
jgi:hypothetical protein